MATYQIVVRTGWIFKTESIVMPAVLDYLGGAAWLRGCLPMINRFGQSIPPLVVARRVKGIPKKKWALTVCTFLMSMAFIGLAVVWFLAGDDAPWLAAVFFICYTLFFMSTGVNQLCFNTLQGKIIRVTRRGRLLLVANVVGALVAVTFAATLMPRWLRADGADFGQIFGFSGICFGIAAFLTLFIRERSDKYHGSSVPLHHLFADARDTFVHDRNFRRLAIVSAMFGTSIVLFPHYQALARSDRLEFDFTNLLGWVIVQNLGTALFSLIAGPLADRFGNRLVLRLVMLGICGAPVLAIVLSYWQNAGRMAFPGVFLLVGLTPVAIKTLHNYTLEISEPEEHTRYLSTQSLCVSLPIFFSPLIGKLIGEIGFDAVFVGVTVLVLFGWAFTFSLAEPRHYVSSDEVGAELADET
jgi:hypothetical protein